MRNPSGFLARRRAASVCLAGAVLLVVTSCAPSPRLYGRLPQAEGRDSFPWDRVDTISYEDDTRRGLQPGEYVQLENDVLVLYGGEQPEPLELSNVEAVRLVPVDGVAEWIDVLTLDDLERFDRLPPIARIERRDGTTWTPDADDDRRASWSTERLAIMIGTGVDDPDAEEILLDEIETIELLEDESIVQVLRSPRLWIAGAAAVGAVILIGRGRGDRDTNATL